MASARLVVLGCLALTVLPLPSTAEFLNEDLVFDEPTRPPHWKVIRRTASDGAGSDSASVSDSDGGWLMATARRMFSRAKRGLLDDWNPFGDSSEEKTTASAATSATEKITSQPLHSNTLSRETRSTDSDDVDVFNSSNRDYLSSLTTDDDDFTSGRTSGDDVSSGEPTDDHFPSPDDEDLISVSSEPPNFGTDSGSSSQRVYYRVTITVHEPYTSELADRESTFFKEFSENFSAAVDKLLVDTEGFQKSAVISVEPSQDVFSSIVTLDIVSEGASNPGEIRERLRRNIDDYRSIGPYTVSSDGFDFRDFWVSSPAGPVSPEVRHTCNPGDIECYTISGEHCLPNAGRCNRTTECQDGSDEAGCPSYFTPDCATGEFVCDLSRCIPQSQVCDGEEQCNDKTDEQNCPNYKDATAMDALFFGYRTVLLEDCCRGIDLEGIEKTRKTFISNHGVIVNSNQVKPMVEGRDRRPELGYKLALELKKKLEALEKDIPE